MFQILQIVKFIATEKPVLITLFLQEMVYRLRHLQTTLIQNNNLLMSHPFTPFPLPKYLKGFDGFGQTRLSRRSFSFGPNCFC